jgi:hypothetical protein
LISPHACALYANILKRAMTSTLSVERCQQLMADTYEAIIVLDMCYSYDTIVTDPDYSTYFIINSLGNA